MGRMTRPKYHIWHNNLMLYGRCGFKWISAILLLYMMKIGNDNLAFPYEKICCKISPLCLSMYWLILWVAWCTVFMYKSHGETSCKHRSPFPAWSFLRVLSNLVRYESLLIKCLECLGSCSISLLSKSATSNSVINWDWFCRRLAISGWSFFLLKCVEQCLILLLA